MPKKIFLYEFNELSDQAKYEVLRQATVFAIFQIVNIKGDQETIPERFEAHRKEYVEGIFTENGKMRWLTDLESDETAKQAAIDKMKADVLSGKVTPFPTRAPQPVNGSPELQTEPLPPQPPTGT